MFNKFMMTTAMVAASSVAAQAQGFAGAELGIEYIDAPNVDELGSVSYYAAGEFALPYGISIALDVSAFDYEVGVSDISNLTAHIIYAINPATSIGFFFGQDFVDDDESEILGAEIAYDYSLGVVEAYIGSGSDAFGEDASLFGVAATYGTRSDFGFEASIDSLFVDGADASTVEVGGFYQLAQGPRFGASFGQVNLSTSDDADGEWFFGLKATIAVGPNNGTTFGQRGAYQVIRTGVPE